MSRKTNNGLIYSIFGKKSFVKVKPAFNIHKIIFSFVERKYESNQKAGADESNVKAAIDIYLDISEAALFAEDILNCRIYKKVDEEAKKKAPFPAPVWKSPLGGLSEGKANRKDGLAISRHFTLSPGSRQYAMLRATSCPGKTDPQGLIVPLKDSEYDKKEKTDIYVGILNYDELRKMALMIRAAVNAYMQQLCSGDNIISNDNEPTKEESKPVANNDSKPVHRNTVTTNGTTEKTSSPKPVNTGETPQQNAQSASKIDSGETVEEPKGLDEKTAKNSDIEVAMMRVYKLDGTTSTGVWLTGIDKDNNYHKIYIDKNVLESLGAAQKEFLHKCEFDRKFKFTMNFKKCVTQKKEPFLQCVAISKV